MGAATRCCRVRTDERGVQVRDGLLAQVALVLSNQGYKGIAACAPMNAMCRCITASLPRSCGCSGFRVFMRRAVHGSSSNDLHHAHR